MVFENVIAQVLNKFIGDYVENLDKNQLNLGIWGGDVELKNLILKQSALDVLGLPFKIVYGQIGLLVLQIPWKNLYGAPFIISVSDIYLVACPDQQVQYNAEKERKHACASKKAELEKIEEAKKREAEKDKPKADPTFVEKLITQIIKNVQLNIKNIHIRYEDIITSPGKPFALGVTLSELDVVSTDEEWRPAITKSDITIIFKVVNLDSLAVYWNPMSPLYVNLTGDEIAATLERDIATKTTQPIHYKYVLGPINALARLRINQTPEQDDPPFSIPKVHLNFNVKTLFIGVSKAQYRDIIEFADSVDRMNKALPYRKYRPNVDGYRGHYKEWWQYAYTCVLEEQVRRRRRDWDWNHIRKHRKLCREYGELYKKKLNNTLKGDVKTKLEHCEDRLDVFNIVLMRQKVELEHKRIEEKQSKQAKGWLGWLWSSQTESTDEDATDSGTILKQFKEAMTPEEKARLFKAIDYHENLSPAEYPDDFIDKSCTFILKTLQIEFRDDEATIPRILFTELIGVKCRVDTRESSKGLLFHAKIDELTTYGLQQDDLIPHIVSSDIDTKENGLLEVTFELNPLDKRCDQRINVTVKPLKIIFDSATIIKVIDIFKVPSSSSLYQLTEAADQKLMNIKEKSSVGLQHMIESHTFIDVNIDLQAPYIIIPHNGKFTSNEDVLIINLGRVRFISLKRASLMIVKDLHQQGKTNEEIFKTMIEQSYDQFKLELTNIQILIAQKKENWLNCMKESNITDMHLLNPVSLHIILSKCLIDDDPRLPLTKISGELPIIDFNLSDARLMLVLAIVTSLPLPQNDDIDDIQPMSVQSKKDDVNRTSTLTLKYVEMQNQAKKMSEKLPISKTNKDQFVQFTTLDIKFVMSRVSLKLLHQKRINSPSIDLLTLSIENLEFYLIQQTYNTTINLRLGGIFLIQHRDDDIIYIITTPFTDNDKYLFDMNFFQIDKNSPEFHTVYKSCESSLSLKFSKLDFILHQDGLIVLMKYANDLQTKVTQITNQNNRQKDRIVSIDELSFGRRMSTISQTYKMATHEKPSKLTSSVVETVKFKLSVSLKELSVEFTSDKCRLSTCAVKGLETEIINKTAYTQIMAKLQDISVIDLNPITHHKMILSCISEEGALDSRIVLYDLAKHETEKPDISVILTMGGLRIVFLNLFVSRMLNFLNKFQAAQQMIIEASQAAAQSAKDNVKLAYSKATKILLDIRLKAPDIFIPQDSKSYDALFIDLGQILLSNTFSNIDIKNNDGHLAVVDNLRMNLKDFNLARIQLDKNYEIINECKLFEPTTLNFTIKRNLSASWYHGIPNIDISGKLDTIMLLLSQTDYQISVDVVSKNLTEIEEPDEPLTPIKREESTESRASRATTTSVAIIESRRLKKIQIIEGDPKISLSEMSSRVSTFLRFSFTIKKIGITLYESDTKSENKQHSGLGRFSLEGISIKTRMFDDKSMVVSMLLLNCILDDLRVGCENKLTRLISRTQDGDIDISVDSLRSSTTTLSDLRSMIDITVQMKDNSIFTDVRVYSFTVILCVDYLLKLAEFFKIEDEKKKEIEDLRLTKSKTKPVTTTIIEETTEQKQSYITLNLKVEKPDIILVEHMDNIDTKALFLTSEILVKLRLSGQHQVIHGTIKDIQLYMCCYNPLKRHDSKYDVLHPMTISLAGSTPEEKGLHVELLITDIHLCVSPATIELLNSVLATATKGGTTTSSTHVELEDYSDLWTVKKFENNDFWYLKPDEAIEASDLLDLPTKRVKDIQELCIVSVPSIIITLEAGVGNKPLPVLLFESSLKGTVRNWSNQLNIEASLTLQMGYYNSRLALWEPLIEPVEIKDNNNQIGNYVPWELKIEISMNEQEDIISPCDEDIINIQPVMNIDITSENNLELTVTKTCLEVLNNLGTSFASAIDDEKTKTSDNDASYKLVNELGCSITLLISNGSFKVANTDKDNVDVVLENGTFAPLQLKEINNKQGLQLQHVLSTKTTTNNERILRIKIDNNNCIIDLPVVRADKRYFQLNYRNVNNENWGLISDIRVDDGIIIITIRSILKVFNHFNVPIDVYYMTKRDNELQSIETIEPNDSLNIPLNAVYTPTNELFFSANDYSVTTTPYIWKDLQTNVSIAKNLYCKPRNKEKGNQNFIIRAIGEMEQVYYENTSKHTVVSTCYNIHLRPSVIFVNCLPLDIVCCIEDTSSETIIERGEQLILPNIDAGKSAIIIRLPDYLEKEWSCRQEIKREPNEFSVWTFNSYDSASKMSVDLGLHAIIENGSMKMSLYCPFWMLNKTGLMLMYRKSKKTEKHDTTGSPSKNSDECTNILYHPEDFKGPILFSFNAKNFFGKKKASVRINNGEWSDKFSLDVAGSSGVISCKSEGLIYQIGVHNQLTYNGLTKQITFTPYYVIINTAPFAIECQENDRPADRWIRVEANSCTPLWPHSQLEDKLLRLRVVNSDEISTPFLYTESHTTLLKLKNQYGGINVDIQLTEGGVYINFAHYEIGMAPALIINDTNEILKFCEKETVQIKELPIKHFMLYTWDNPSGPRILTWETGQQKKDLSTDLRKDILGEYPINDKLIFYVSFLDGMQRILLFTENQTIAENAQAAKLFEIIQQEITISIHGVGLSLVNNLTRQEIMYLAIASSGVIWEQCKINSRRFKHMNSKDSMLLERAYQLYLTNIEKSFEPDGHIVIDNTTEVDFKLGLMSRPRKRKIRRTYQTGLWIQMKSSPSQLHLHGKINRLQIDNQMFDCIFPVVLAPVPLPKSVAIDSGIKPFAEISIVQLLIKNSQIKQYKYFKLLIQEFHIKVDLGFINALVDCLQNTEQNNDDIRKQFLEDCSLVDKQLFEHVSSQSIQEQKSFYDLLHFSPLKVHISFSMATGHTTTDQNATPNFLNVLLQGIGVTLTDLQDVVFKLAFFERSYTFLTRKQLISEATKHYVGQTVKQLYVLVLGLDVIGNPYGLVLGITKGVEDLFYEPFQGAIQGPGEFAEGLALGVRSLFGHTVGGAAGAASRITGALGKGIAALTFDQDYQRKRRDQLNKRPSTVQEGIARGGKGLVMGVVDGVTGVVTKPISGAKEEGFGGFLKGLGKGAVGLIAHPTSGVVDFASNSLDAIKRAAETSEDTNRLRYPRFLQNDGLVRPYNQHESYGHKLLYDLDKGKYSTTDIYAYHYVVIESKEILLLTDKRIAYVTHNDLFGSWQVDWSYTWQILTHPATVVPKGVRIPPPDTKKKLFGSNHNAKVILIADPQKREEICMKIELLRGNA